MRDIVLIDEELCDGCGACIPSCHEGAIQLVDGKARLLADRLCDGLGNCLGTCPKDAIKIIKREAEAFDEAAVEAHLKTMGQEHAPGQAQPQAKTGGCPGSAGQTFFKDAPASAKAPMPCGCPGSAAQTFAPKAKGEVGPMAGPQESNLGHWPVKLRLLPAEGGAAKGRGLLLTADCAPAAWAGFNRELSGKAMALCCPKFEDNEAAIEKLAAILKNAKPTALGVLRMEVPCCAGLANIAREAAKRAGFTGPVRQRVITRQGEAKAPEAIEQSLFA